MKNTSQKTIKKKKASGNSREDKMMVLLEDMRDEIKLVAESHSVLKSQLDSMQLDSDEFKEETRRNFKLVFEHFSNVEDELVGINSEMKNLRKVLTDKADLERLAVLEERVRKLEMQQVILRDEAEKEYESGKK